MAGKHGIRTVLAVAVALVMGAVPAGAQQTVSDDTNVTVMPGRFAIEGGGVDDFPDLNVIGMPQDARAGVEKLTVIDARGSGDGWHVTAQATPFKGQQTSPDQEADAFPSDSMSLAPLGHAKGVGTGSPPPVVPDKPMFVDGGGAVVVASAAPDTGMGIFELTFNREALHVFVPGYAKAGAYRSRVLFTLVSGPSPV